LQHTWHLLHLQPEQDTSSSYSYCRHRYSRTAALPVSSTHTAMAATSIPAAVMPATPGVRSEVPAAPTKLPGGTPGAATPTAASYSTILGTSLALNQIHKVRCFECVSKCV
jgi:hypothetical protein